MRKKEVPNSKHLVAACGLYCGACRRYRRGRCPGCGDLDLCRAGWQRPVIKLLKRCSIRRCCHRQGLATCADCATDASLCPKLNTPLSRLAARLFGSDREACLRFIRNHGAEAYAEEMAWHEQMALGK